MHIELSDEQTMLQDVTREFLAKESPVVAVRAVIDEGVGFDPDVWRRGADLGWTAILLAEEFGGSGSDQPVLDAALIAEELGRLVHPGPFIPNAVTAFAVAGFGSDELRGSVLPGLLSGEQTASWCLAEGDNQWDPDAFSVTATAHGTGYVISGTKDLVQEAESADYLLVTARDARGPMQVVIPARTPGVVVTPLDSLDLTRRFGRVRLDEVEVPADAVLSAIPAHEQWQQQFEIAAVLNCAETVGLMERIFEMTLDYANDRFAFGRAIGSFQAIKHMCADMLAWLESAKAITNAAIDAVQSESDDAAQLVSSAKAYVGEYGSRLIERCLQVFGGIGYTWEHDLHLYLRRAKSNEVLYGTPTLHRERLCRLMGMAVEDGEERNG